MTPDLLTDHPPRTTDDFPVELERVLSEVRLALADSLAAVGADPTRPQQMARDLKLNKNLTWKVASLLRESDAATASTFLPGEEGLRIVARALRTAGAPETSVHAVENGAAALADLVQAHAGDRATFDLMVGAMSQGEHRVPQLEASRKLAFRGNSAIFGVQARLQLAIFIVAPSQTPNMLDTAIATCLVDLARLRPGVSWNVASRFTYDDDGTYDETQSQPLDPEFAGTARAPLLPRFCSDPLPELNIMESPDGATRFELPGGPIGRSATITCATGWVFRGTAQAQRSEGNTFGEFGTNLVTPAECVIHELFVHESLTFAHNPKPLLFSQLPGGRTYPSSGAQSVRIPLAEQLEALVGDPTRGILPEYADYRALLHEVFGRLQWSPNNFRGFRMRLRYPPIPTMLVSRFPLPE